MANSAKEYSNRAINKAGLIIRDSEAWSNEVDEAYNVVGAWRTLHATPMREVLSVLERRATSVDQNALVSSRLKRIPSVAAKLRRPQYRNMKLSTMQDLGGCRAVVGTMEQVRQLASQYNLPKRDYIAEPKADGYRSLHIVERYEPANPEDEKLSGLQIEIQIRSRLQHVWATAVETVDFGLEQNLKIGGGQDDWKKFFALAASALAHQEGCPLVPGTPSDKQHLADDLKVQSERLDAFGWLQGLNLAAYSAKSAYEQELKQGKNSAAFIVILDMTEKPGAKTTVMGFKEENLKDANAEYVSLEKTFFGDDKQHVLLVSVDRIADLRPAYPAFFVDAHQFIWALQEFIRGNVS